MAGAVERQGGVPSFKLLGRSPWLVERDRLAHRWRSTAFAAGPRPNRRHCRGVHGRRGRG